MARASFDCGFRFLHSPTFNFHFPSQVSLPVSRLNTRLAHLSSSRPPYSSPYSNGSYRPSFVAQEIELHDGREREWSRARMSWIPPRRDRHDHCHNQASTSGHEHCAPGATRPWYPGAGGEHVQLPVHPGEETRLIRRIPDGTYTRSIIISTSRSSLAFLFSRARLFFTPFMISRLG